MKNKVKTYARDMQYGMDHTEHKSEHERHNHRDEHTEHDSQAAHVGHGGHSSHHAHMIADFRKRFWVSLVQTVPILFLSPMIQSFLGFRYYLFLVMYMYFFMFAPIVFFYGGYPFLKGLSEELKKKQPGMVTLIAVAITTAYAYSSAIVFGVAGKLFFWELASLIDIKLLGHWIEMKSIMGHPVPLTNFHSSCLPAHTS